MRMRIPDHASRLAEGAPGIAAIYAARVELEPLGVPLGSDSTIDVLVQSVRDKRNDEQTRFLVWDRDVPVRAIARLAPKVFVVSVEFCAFEAAKEMGELELIEYYFELCSTYALPEDGATTSIVRLRSRRSHACGPSSSPSRRAAMGARRRCGLCARCATARAARWRPP